ALTCVSVISMDRQALSQIDAGTIVTIYFDGKKIVMAADSMAVSGNAAEPPSYSQCKLAALDKRIIFASVGADSWRDNNSLISIGSWDNITEARYAFYSALEHKDDDTLLGTVDRWGKLLMDHWNALYHINRSEVIWAS